MTKVVRSKDCGNSPKNKLVEDLAVALALGDFQTVSRLVTDDVRWSLVGGKVFSGRQAVLEALENVNAGTIKELNVSHVITHGRSGAVNGTIHYHAAAIGFCDVFDFGSAKGTSISQITSYQIDI